MTNVYPNIAAVVLAAGRSTRFGSDDKLLAQINGVPMLRLVVDRVTSVGFGSVIVVVPPNAIALQKLLRQSSVQVIENNSHEEGMGSSISCAVQHISRLSLLPNGIAIFLGDMPFIETSTIALICDEFHRRDDKFITRPCFDGIPGHPVIFPIGYRKELQQLVNDRDAKELVLANHSQLRSVDVDQPGATMDIDTISDRDTSEPDTPE